MGGHDWGRGATHYAVAAQPPRFVYEWWGSRLRGGLASSRLQWHPGGAGWQAAGAWDGGASKSPRS